MTKDRTDRRQVAKAFLEIAAEYAPYHTMLAFHKGAEAFMDRVYVNPYGSSSVEAQAWDRGCNAAMRFLQPTVMSIDWKTGSKSYKIITVYSAKPIPDRQYDWCAWRDDGKEELTTYGHGSTEAEAIKDLLEQEEDEAETAR